MSYTEGLIDSLKEWNELCKSESTDVKGLVSIALLNLGSLEEDIKKDDYDVNSLEYLTKRINKLKEQGIFEEFLVNGVLKVIDDFFTEQLNSHGVFLIDNERMYEDALKMGGELERFALERKRDAEYYRSHQYILDKENELDIWNIVKNKHFSKTNKRKWELELKVQASKDYALGLDDEELKQLEEMKAKLRSNRIL